MTNRIIRWYAACVLDHPLRVLLLLTALIALLGYKALDFKIDASTESLLLENDPDLRYAREIGQRYGLNDFLLISFMPHQGDLLDDANLAAMRQLRDELRQLEQVASVVTLLDVPLLQSPPISYAELSGGMPTLDNAVVDTALARIELRDSPFYRDLLVSPDLHTAAIIVYLKPDPVYSELVARRSELLDRRTDGGLSGAEAAELRDATAHISRRQDHINAVQHTNIATIRAIMDRHRDQGELFLGGISMISDDLITFVRNDLKIFGMGVFALLVIMLGIIFRRIRWVVLPMLCCFASVVAMIGLLGTFNWQVTVISSNFVSLQLIITMSMVVHLIVRYREYRADHPRADQRTLVQKTVGTIFTPCLYAILTSMAGFVSLLLCDIKPVIHFGLMMGAGIFISLGLTFLIFPSVMMLLDKPIVPAGRQFKIFSLTGFTARLTLRHGRAILVVAGIFTLLATWGTSRLVVENSFIDYFKASTEIHQGMTVIDQRLGGTTPLDVIVRFPSVGLAGQDDLLDEDDLLSPWEDQAVEDNNKYWFFEDRMQRIEAVHDYLEELPESGKVLSLGTLLKVGRTLNKGKSLDSLEMAVLYTKLPSEYRELLLTPFLSFERNEARFSIRIKDSLQSLKRDALLRQIQQDLAEKWDFAPDEVRLAGTMVLYNNMLQSLFSSQIKTMGFVALALMVMFVILFRSFKLALIALYPNLLSAGSVLALMGWTGIPLDMMTITIAAISMGIAVDDTIHYICRFREEFKQNGNYHEALQRCHGSIGHAMFYTSQVIIVGFSILTLSNFWPTIYFGLLTGLAMFVALVCALTLLPQLLVWVKPFGPDRNPIPTQTGTSASGKMEVCIEECAL
jgi:uncharacterized protein